MKAFKFFEMRGVYLFSPFEGVLSFVDTPDSFYRLFEAMFPLADVHIVGISSQEFEIKQVRIF